MTLLAALALPADALAKEPVKATVCGANGCASSGDKDAILPLVEGGPPASRLPTSGAPAYRVRLTIAAGPDASGTRRRTFTFTNWMSPQLGLIRGAEGTWMTMPATTLAALRRVARDIRPFPAARLPLGGRLVGPEGGAPLQSSAPEPARTPASGGTDWRLAGGLAAGVLAMLAVAALAIAHRRRSRPPTEAARVS